MFHNSRSLPARFDLNGAIFWTILLSVLNGLAILSLSLQAGRDAGIAVLLVTIVLPVLVLVRNDATALIVSVVGLALAVEARVPLYGYSVSVIEIVSLSLIILFMLLLWAGNMQSPTRYEVLLLGFICMLVLIIPWAHDLQHAFSDLRDWFWPFVIFYMLRRVLAVERYWRSARGAFLIGAMFSASYGIGEAAWSLPAPFINESALGKTFLDFDRMRFQRVSPAVGFQEHPNAFAIYLVIAIVLIASDLSTRRTLTRRCVSCAGLGLLVVGLYFTYTKTAFAGLILCVLPLPLVRRWRLSLLKTAMIVGMGMLAAIAMIDVLEKNVGGEILSTYYARETAWDTSLVKLSDPWVLLFGNGLESVQKETGMHPHNAWLYLLVSYGLIATCIAIAAMISAARIIINRAREMWGRGDGRLAEAVTMLALYLCVTSFFESIILGVNERCLLAFVASLLLTWPKAENRVSALSEQLS